MENKNYYNNKQVFGASIIMLGLMAFHLFVMNISLDGRLSGVWIGMAIVGFIKVFVIKSKEIELIIIPGFMIGNYILFRNSIYIPNYIILFSSLSVLLVYYSYKGNSKYRFHKIFLIVMILAGFFIVEHAMYKDNIIRDRNFIRLLDKKCAVGGELKKEDLHGIEQLSLSSGYFINNIDGIEYFKDLKRLTIWEGGIIKDLSPVSSLSNLEHLMLGYVNLNRIDEIGKMSSLEWLEIIYPKGGKVENLTNFPNLKSLHVHGMDFKDLTMLKGPSELEYLGIAVGQVISFDGIENFPNLKELDLYKLYISDSSKIFELKNLEKINLEGCNIYKKDDFEKMAKERGIAVKK